MNSITHDEYVELRRQAMSSWAASLEEVFYKKLEKIFVKELAKEMAAQDQEPVFEQKAY